MAATMTPTAPAQRAAAIPAPGHAEAAGMAAVELDRFLALLEGLAPEDWARPTACTLWNVREVVAHQAGSYARMASWAEFRRQVGRAARRPYQARGMSQLDAMNQLQVDDRCDCSPAELIAELRRVGPSSVETRRRLPWLLRALRMPAPPYGWWPVGYLTDVILTRDTWIHRLDLCRATGRPMALTADHDGRITELVARDLATKLRDEPVVYELGGPAGGTWRFGAGTPIATLRMDALDFHLIAAERLSPADALAAGLVAVWGDPEAASHALARTAVAY